MKIKVDGSEMEEIKWVVINEGESNSVNDALVSEDEELCEENSEAFFIVAKIATEDDIHPLDDSWFEPESALTLVYEIEESDVDFDHYAKKDKSKLLLHGADLDQNYSCNEDGASLERGVYEIWNSHEVIAERYVDSDFYDNSTLTCRGFVIHEDNEMQTLAEWEGFGLDSQTKSREKNIHVDFSMDDLESDVLALEYDKLPLDYCDSCHFVDNPLFEMNAKLSFDNPLFEFYNTSDCWIDAKVDLGDVEPSAPPWKRIWKCKYSSVVQLLGSADCAGTLKCY